jgi:hypothetical protein
VRGHLSDSQHLIIVDVAHVLDRGGEDHGAGIAIAQEHGAAHVGAHTRVDGLAGQGPLLGPHRQVAVPTQGNGLKWFRNKGPCMGTSEAAGRIATDGQNMTPFIATGKKSIEGETLQY